MGPPLTAPIFTLALVSLSCSRPGEFDKHDTQDHADDTDEPPDTVVVDTEPWTQTLGPLPLATAACMIPRPGSLASLGAITEYHLPNNIRFVNDGNSGDLAMMGRPIDQDAMFDDMPINRLVGTGPGEEYLQVVDLSSVRGTVIAESLTTMGRINAIPGARRWAPTSEWSADLDHDGKEEMLGFYPYEGKLSVFGWDTPIPNSASIDAAPWKFVHSGWSSQETLQITIGDWNADGVDDLYVSGDYGPLGRTDVFAAGPFPRSPLGSSTDLAPSVYAEIHWGSPWAVGTFATTGDFNGDGVDDIAISAIRDAPELGVFFGPLRGQLDGRRPDATISTTRPRAPGDYNALYAFNIGDQDGDGSDDLAISNLFEEDFTGSVYVFLGPLARGVDLLDVDAWARIRWIHPGAQTGARLSAANDVNGDGRRDLIVSAHGARGDLEPPGALPMAPLPDGVILPPPLSLEGEPGSPVLIQPEAALMLFTDLRPGDLGPQDAALVVKGSQPGVAVDLSLLPLRDIDGDGLGDFAFVALNLEHEVAEAWIYLLRPCADFGVMVP